MTRAAFKTPGLRPHLTSPLQLALLLLCIFTTARALEPASALPDPTRPRWQPPVAAGAHSATTGTVSARPRLDGIVFSAQRRLAIIRGRTYRQGANVASLRLQEIHADHVVLTGPDGRQIWRLPAPVTIRRSGANNPDSPAAVDANKAPPDKAPPEPAPKYREKADHK